MRKLEQIDTTGLSVDDLKSRIIDNAVAMAMAMRITMEMAEKLNASGLERIAAIIKTPAKDFDDLKGFRMVSESLQQRVQYEEQQQVVYQRMEDHSNLSEALAIALGRLEPKPVKAAEAPQPDPGEQRREPAEQTS